MKTKFSILFLLFLLGLFPVFHAGADCGDTNGDGITDILDALQVALFYPPMYTPPDADVNCDNSVTIIDALMIAQFDIGVLPDFGTCCSNGPYRAPDPLPSPQPLPARGEPGTVWIDAPARVYAKEPLKVAVHISSGSQDICAYRIELRYDPAFVFSDDSNVRPGKEGFLTVVDADTPGRILMNGFDVYGRPGGSDLEMLLLEFTPLAAGDLNLELIIWKLLDTGFQEVGTPCGFGATVVLTDYLPGDANGDGTVNIVDALITAQVYVGIKVPVFNAAAADYNYNGKLEIIDALMIAQHYVGLI